MVIQFADYCNKRADKTFETLLKTSDNMLEHHRRNLIRILKQCQRVKRFTHRLERKA